MKRVLVVCGGISEEHEISLLSARSIIEAIDPKKYEPLVVGISKKGEWYFEDPKSFFTGEPKADRIQLNTNRPKAQVQPGKASVVSEGKEYPFDVAFPVLHGRGGEDGTIQGLFELMKVAYVGSDVGASWVCMDKAISKSLCQADGIAVADFLVLSPGDKIPTPKFGFPCFVKPSRTGSSVGIRKVISAAQLESAVKEAFRHDSKVLIEKAITAREIECAVLGPTNKPKVAPIGEIIPNPKVGWYSYEAKYLMADGADLKVPAKLSAKEAREAQALSQRIFTLLECYGMARVDLFLEAKTGKWYFNEVNTIPGFTPISMYPRLWLEHGLSYPDLIAELIELALRRV